MYDNFFDQHPDPNHPSNVAKREAQTAQWDEIAEQIATTDVDAIEKAQKAEEEAEQERVDAEKRMAESIIFLDGCVTMSIEAGLHYWLHPLPREFQGKLYEKIHENLLDNRSHIVDGKSDRHWKLPLPYIDLAANPDRICFLHKCYKCGTTQVIEDFSTDVPEECRFHPQELERNTRIQGPVCSGCHPDWDELEFEKPRHPLPPCESYPVHEWKPCQDDPFWTDAALLYSKDFEIESRDTHSGRVIVIDAEMVNVEHNGQFEVEIITFSAVDLFTNEVLINEIVRPHGSDRNTAKIDFKEEFTGFNQDRFDLACSRNLPVTLRDLQGKVLSLLGPGAIIAGWGVHNDMKCLRLAHPRVFDLQVLYRRKTGPTPSLAKAANEYGIDLQPDVHSSLKDALGTAEIIRRWNFNETNEENGDQSSQDGGSWKAHVAQLDQQELARQALERENRYKEWQRRQYAPENADVAC